MLPPIVCVILSVVTSFVHAQVDTFDFSALPGPARDAILRHMPNDVDTTHAINSASHDIKKAARQPNVGKSTFATLDARWNVRRFPKLSLVILEKPDLLLQSQNIYLEYMQFRELFNMRQVYPHAKRVHVINAPDDYELLRAVHTRMFAMFPNAVDVVLLDTHLACYLNYVETQYEHLTRDEREERIAVDFNEYMSFNTKNNPTSLNSLPILHKAIEWNSIPLIDSLLRPEYKVDVNKMHFEFGSASHPPLMLALSLEAFPAAQRLLQAGAQSHWVDPETRESAFCGIITAKHALSGNFDQWDRREWDPKFVLVANMLISDGVSIKTCPGRQPHVTPLYYAAATRHLLLAEFLMNKGAVPTREEMHAAAYYGTVDVLYEMLKRSRATKTDIDKPHNLFHSTPIPVTLVSVVCFSMSTPLVVQLPGGRSKTLPQPWKNQEELTEGHHNIIRLLVGKMGTDIRQATAVCEVNRRHDLAAFLQRQRNHYFARARTTKV